jgi:sulfur carrier protein
VNVLVNGKPRALPDHSSVKDLIDVLDLGARQVVVEVNGEPVERSRFAAVELGSGDVVEVVRAVPGG